MPPVDKIMDSFCAWMSWGKHRGVESVKLNNTQAVRYCLKVITTISPVVCSRCIAMRVSPEFDGHLCMGHSMLRDWVRTVFGILGETLRETLPRKSSFRKPVVSIMKHEGGGRTS